MNNARIAAHTADGSGSTDLYPFSYLKGVIIVDPFNITRLRLWLDWCDIRPVTGYQ